jgi:hypothetical protein
MVIYRECNVKVTYTRSMFLLLTIFVTKSYVTKGEGVVVVVIIRELHLELPMQSLHSFEFESLSCEVYSILQYIMKFVNDLR